MGIECPEEFEEVGGSHTFGFEGLIVPFFGIDVAPFITGTGLTTIEEGHGAGENFEDVVKHVGGHEIDIAGLVGTDFPLALASIIEPEAFFGITAVHDSGAEVPRVVVGSGTGVFVVPPEDFLGTESGVTEENQFGFIAVASEGTVTGIGDMDWCDGQSGTD